MVLHRELKAMGYGGAYTTLKRYVSPRRRRRQADAIMRFQTAPGGQALVDWVEVYTPDRFRLEEALRKNGKTLPVHVHIIERKLAVRPEGG